MSNKYEATFHPGDGPTDHGAREALVEQITEALQKELGCFERESVTNGEHYCGKHRHLWLDRRGCQDAAIAARAVLPVVAAQVEAAVSVVQAERETEVAQLREALRIGIELDNHHNAAVCPYCKPRRGSAEADLWALREGLEAIVNDPTVHPLPLRDRLRALLASSPAEGTGEADHFGVKLRASLGRLPAPVATPSAEDGAPC